MEKNPKKMFTLVCYYSKQFYRYLASDDGIQNFEISAILAPLVHPLYSLLKHGPPFIFLT